MVYICCNDRDNSRLYLGESTWTHSPLHAVRYTREYAEELMTRTDLCGFFDDAYLVDSGGSA